MQRVAACEPVSPIGVEAAYSFAGHALGWAWQQVLEHEEGAWADYPGNDPVLMPVVVVATAGSRSTWHEPILNGTVAADKCARLLIVSEAP